MAKIHTQLEARVKSKNIKPPNTARIATSGIIALIPSAAPRLVLSVLSVNHALNAASLAEEPKKVITQSRIITREIATADALVASQTVGSALSARIKQKPRIEMPHKM